MQRIRAVNPWPYASRRVRRGTTDCFGPSNFCASGTILSLCFHPLHCGSPKPTFKLMNDDLLLQQFTTQSGLTLKNRVVMAPLTTTSGEPDGSFSDQEIAYLKERAESGVGLIMSPACYVHPTGHAFERQVGCHSDDLLPSLTRCADAINSAGAASFLQIHHGGSACNREISGLEPIAPSAVQHKRAQKDTPRAMTGDEIRMIIESFAKAAGRAKRAGFTGIEIHGANTYLLQQFFSPHMNQRDDEWGAQTFENRSRFASEVVKAIREEVGTSYPISYRISPEEDEPDGYAVEDAIKLLETILPLGVDIVHVSSIGYTKGLRDSYPNGSNPTKMIKDALGEDIPVIGVGGVFTPDDADVMLNDGIDLVALGRALLLNHDWMQRAASSDYSTIRRTISSEEELQALHIPDHMKDYIRWWALPED